VKVVLDAWAVLALLQGEPPGHRVREAIAGGQARMSSVNLGEVHYSLVRAFGRSVAVQHTDAVQKAVAVEDVDWDLVRAAAEVKAEGGMSYADAFCVATARRHGLPLMTGDREIVDAALDVEVIDLRAAA
jgi:PIN domain nuclease of toxin-antitoxin system